MHRSFYKSINNTKRTSNNSHSNSNNNKSTISDTIDNTNTISTTTSNTTNSTNNKVINHLNTRRPIYYDFQHLPVTISSELTHSECELLIGYINEYMYQVFSYGNSWFVICQALLLDSNCLLANILMCDYLVANEEFNTAQEYLQRAKLIKSTGIGTQRERWYCTAWSIMLAATAANSNSNSTVLSRPSSRSIGRSRAGPVLQKLINHYPADLFAVKKAQLIAFLQGDEKRMLQLVEQKSVAAACSHRPFYNGMLAFALEENRRLFDAERAAKLALTIFPADVWAIHSLAHCYYSTGKLQLGIEFMELHQYQWEYCMSFLYTHCNYHLALFYLDLEQFDKVKLLLDEKIWRLDSNQTITETMEESGISHGHIRVEQNNTNNNNDSNNSNSNSSTSNNNISTATTNIPALSRHTICDDGLFLQQDKRKSEDQSGAMNLLWKWEMRMTGAGSTGYKRVQQQAPSVIVKAGLTEAESITVQTIDTTIDSNIPLTAPELTNRYQSIIEYIRWPCNNLLSLFGILLLHTLCRSGYSNRAIEVFTEIQSKVNSMNDSVNDLLSIKYKYLTVFIPICESIIVLFNPNPNNNYSMKSAAIRAYQLLHPIFSVYEKEDSKTTTAILNIDNNTNNINTDSAATVMRHGHDLITVLGCSSEQRSVLFDYWLEILFLSCNYSEGFSWAKSQIKYRDCSSYLHSTAAVCLAMIATQEQKKAKLLKQQQLQLQSQQTVPVTAPIPLIVQSKL